MIAQDKIKRRGCVWQTWHYPEKDRPMSAVNLWAALGFGLALSRACVCVCGCWWCVREREVDKVFSNLITKKKIVYALMVVSRSSWILSNQNIHWERIRISDLEGDEWFTRVHEHSLGGFDLGKVSLLWKTKLSKDAVVFTYKNEQNKKLNVTTFFPPSCYMWSIYKFHK